MKGIGAGLVIAAIALAGVGRAAAQPAARVDRCASARRTAQLRASCARARRDARRSPFGRIAAGALPPYLPPEWLLRGATAEPVLPDAAELARQLAAAHRHIAGLRPTEPGRPDALLRLAELQVIEADAAAARAADLETRVAEAAANGDATTARMHRQALSTAQLTRDRNRAEATQTLDEILRVHPTFLRLDAAVLLLARVLETLGERARASWILRDQAQRVAHLAGAPAVFVAAADLFAEDAQIATALSFYERALDTPAARNPLYGYAQYRRALALRDIGDRRESARVFVELLVFLDTHPTLPDREALLSFAERDACTAL